MRKWSLVVVAVLMVVATAACGSGEDRPGQVSASASASGSGSGSGSGSSAGGEHSHDDAGDGGEDEAPAFPADEATTKVDVTLQDYAFLGVPDTVAGPKVFFTAKIKGSNTHELEVLDPSGEPVDEIEAFEGTKAKTLAVELEPGTYTLQCLVEEGAKTHKQLGMVKTFEVTAT